MSMYDNDDKDEVFDVMERFLERYKIYDLLQIVKDAVEYMEDKW